MKRIYSRFIRVFLLLFVVFALFSCDIERIIVTHTVAFDVDGGNDIDAVVIEKGKTLTLPVPEKIGHAFMGWYYDATWNDAVSTESLTAYMDLVLYAKWDLLDFTLRWHPENGDPSIEISHPYGSPLEHLDDPLYEDHVFLGWFEALANTPFEAQTMPAHDLNVYARWYQPSILDTLRSTVGVGQNFTFIFENAMSMSEDDVLSTRSGSITFMREGLSAIIDNETRYTMDDSEKIQQYTQVALNDEAGTHTYYKWTSSYTDEEGTIHDDAVCWHYALRSADFVDQMFAEEGSMVSMVEMISIILHEGLLIDWFDDDNQTLTLKEAYYTPYMTLLDASEVELNHLIIHYGGDAIEILFSGTEMYDDITFDYRVVYKDVGTTVIEIPANLDICEIEPEPVFDGSIAYLVPIQEYYNHSMLFEVYQGIENYANELNYEILVDIARTHEETVDAIVSAISQGATIIVLAGLNTHGNTVWFIQDDFPDVTFILYDRMPSNVHPTTGEVLWGDAPDYTIKDNVFVLLRDEYQAGFLAGYALVFEGYRDLGFIGYNDSHYRAKSHGYGFVEGANAAATMLELADDAVKIRFLLAGLSFSPPSEITVLADAWYQDGVEVIFSTAWFETPFIVDVAETIGKGVIGFWDDRDTIESPALLGSSKTVYTQTIYDLLTCITEETCMGGDVIITDASWQGVALDLDFEQFNTFTPETYEALLAELAAGEFNLHRDVTLSLEDLNTLTTKVTLISIQP